MLKAKDYHWNIQSNHLKTMQRSVTKNSIEKLKCNSIEYSVNQKSGRKKKKSDDTNRRQRTECWSKFKRVNNDIDNWYHSVIDKTETIWASQLRDRDYWNEFFKET